MTLDLQFSAVRGNWKCLLEFLTLLSSSYKNCAGVISPPWVSASDLISSVFFGTRWDGLHPDSRPGLGRGGRAQWGPQPQTLDPAVEARRRRRKRVYHLGDLDCSRLKFNPKCVLSLAMLFKHIKGHKDSKGVSRSRREPAGSQHLILVDFQSQNLERGAGRAP